MKEINFDLEFENFYCPITGKQVLDPDQLNHSYATVFPFLDTEDVFEHPQKDLVEKIAKKVKDETRHRELDQKHTETIFG